MIRNFYELATSELRRDALAIAEAGFEAINTEKVIMDNVQVVSDELHIADKIFKIAGKKVFYVGVGKCAISAGRAIEKILGDALTAGIALDVAAGEQASQKPETGKLEVIIGTHPFPSEANAAGSKRILGFLADKNENDLVIFVISGGGSTLLCLPTAPITCTEESELFKKLTNEGVPIRDLNTVRKHLSRARGGALAAAAYPAEIISLIASDVPNDDIEVVASGPTVLDSSTIDDAKAILAKHEIEATGVEFIETPKEQKYFERVTNMLILSNKDALSAMKDEAVRRGFATTVMNEHLSGEARDIGYDIVKKLHNAPSKTAFLYAGESTVTISAESGNGGRNQEMALSALSDIRDDEIILPFASDGRDNTTHAGAIADEITRARAREKNLSIKEHLHAHSSYDFFKFSGDALITGYTGSNVSDLVIALKK